MEEDLDGGQPPPAKRTRWSPTGVEKEARSARRREKARLAMARRRSQESERQAASRRVSNQEHMANCRSTETAEQVAARREREQQQSAERRSQETTVQADARRARNQERAADRRAGERVVSLEVGDFGDRSVIDKRTWTNLGCLYDHTHDYANHSSLKVEPARGAKRRSSARSSNARATPGWQASIYIVITQLVPHRFCS